MARLRLTTDGTVSVTASEHRSQLRNRVAARARLAQRIASALVLYVVLVLVGLLVYSPTLKKQIGALESGGTTSPEYTRLSQRGTGVGLALAVDVLLIVFLMVVKPTL